MRGFGGFNSSTSEKISNELKIVYMRLRKIEDGVAVTKLRVNSGGGCFEIQVWTNASKLTNMRIT